MSKSGTPRKVTIDGETFNVAADANFAQTPGQTNEGVRHTGGTLMKSTLNVENVESVTLIADGTQFESLKEKSKRDVNYPMSYELASGDVYRAPGMITLDNRETEENRVDITMIPDGEWEPFLS
jgi:hypothetical protein